MLASCGLLSHCLGLVLCHYETLRECLVGLLCSYLSCVAYCLTASLCLVVSHYELMSCCLIAYVLLGYCVVTSLVWPIVLLPCGLVSHCLCRVTT